MGHVSMLAPFGPSAAPDWRPGRSSPQDLTKLGPSKAAPRSRRSCAHGPPTRPIRGTVSCGAPGRVGCRQLGHNLATPSEPWRRAPDSAMGTSTKSRSCIRACGTCQPLKLDACGLQRVLALLDIQDPPHTKPISTHPPELPHCPIATISRSMTLGPRRTPGLAEPGYRD